jgi:hypothetical protein
MWRTQAPRYLKHKHTRLRHTGLGRKPSTKYGGSKLIKAQGTGSITIQNRDIVRSRFTLEFTITAHGLELNELIMGYRLYSLTHTR